MSETYIRVRPDGVAALAGRLSAPAADVRGAAAAAHAAGVLAYANGGMSRTGAAAEEFARTARAALAALAAELDAIRDAMAAAARDYAATDGTQAVLLGGASP